MRGLCFLKSFTFVPSRGAVCIGIIANARLMDCPPGEAWRGERHSWYFRKIARGLRGALCRSLLRPKPHVLPHVLPRARRASGEMRALTRGSGRPRRLCPPRGRAACLACAGPHAAHRFRRALLLRTERHRPAETRARNIPQSEPQSELLSVPFRLIRQS